MDHHTQSPPVPPPPPPHQQHTEPEDHPTTTTATTSYTYKLLLTIMSKRRTWVCLFILVYTLLLSSSWNLLQSILTWYRTSPSRSRPSQAVFASLMLGAVFGLISMAAALAVALPSMLITWITILVLLTFCGKPRSVLLVDGRKITVEIARFVGRVLVKEGNFVAIFCAVLWYFVLYHGDDDDDDIG